MTLVAFHHVSCGYGGDTVIEDVSLSVKAHEFVGIVGPSGGGKTTVLRALLGSLRPVFGTVECATDLQLAYVPQVETVDWNFPVTVDEVVSMSVPRPRFRRTAPDPRVAEVLDQLGLGEVRRRHIRELSGGQQQRVFLARALVQQPDLLVLDEPAASVDVRTRHELLHLLDGLNAGGLAILLTTHDLNGLAAHLPRLVCFNRTVIADGPPAEVLHPYVLERTYGAPMNVLSHGGMPVVLERDSTHARNRLRGRSA